MANFTKVDGKNIGSIKLYALSTCGWCKRTKKYLDDKGIQYNYIDVDKIDNSDELKSIRE